MVVGVPVIRAFTHEGRAFSVGETITVAPVVAAALHYQGYVSLTKGYQTAAVIAEAEPAAPRRRRRYRRRDMAAE